MWHIGKVHIYLRKNTHTHPFNSPLSGTTRVGQFQKGKTNLDFTEARDSEWQWHQLDHMQLCTSLWTDNHASTPPLCFLQARCPSCRPTNSIKALKARHSSPNTKLFSYLRSDRVACATLACVMLAIVVICRSWRTRWMHCVLQAVDWRAVLSKAVSGKWMALTACRVLCMFSYPTYIYPHTSCADVVSSEYQSIGWCVPWQSVGRFSWCRCWKQ